MICNIEFDNFKSGFAVEIAFFSLIYFFAAICKY